MPHTDSTPRANLELRAFAANHRSEVVDRGRCYQADLISVSYRGARLRVPEHEAGSVLREGQDLVLNLRISRAEGATENVACLVRWMQGGDLGVDFSRPLPVGVTDLQCWLDT